MKKKLFVLAFCVLGLTGLTSIEAQVKTPAPSPLSEVSQKVGLGEVKIVYSRPGMKGRTVMGELVPYGKVWRTGANQRTQIHFSEDVMLQGTKVPAGKYAILTIPGEESWEIILGNDLSGSPMEIGDEEQTITFEAPAKKMDMTVETFTIMINDIRDASATINIMWENTIVPIEMELHTDKMVLASIESTMAGPGKDDYFAAAQYYYNNDKDLKKALDWVEKSMNENETRYWVVTLKARILNKMGNKQDALATAEKAKELAEKGNNPDYVKINEDIIAELKD